MTPSQPRESASIEWRVLSLFPLDKKRGNPPFEVPCRDEKNAREWAEIERREYPHCEVWIERREVSSWERVDA